MTSCDLYHQTVICSRARDFIHCRAPLALSSVHTVFFYVMVKLAENEDGRVPTLPGFTFVVSQTPLLVRVQQLV